MDYEKLIASVLVVVLRFALVWFFDLIGFAVDAAMLDTLVAAIVAWLLALFFAPLPERGVRAIWHK